MAERAVSVDAPCGAGGRRVCIGEQALGMVYSLHELTLLLRRAGLVDGDELDVAGSDLIEWHSGGPEVWRLLRPRRAYPLNDDIHGTNHQAGRRAAATELRAVPQPCQILRGTTGKTRTRSSSPSGPGTVPSQVSKAPTPDSPKFPSLRPQAR